MLNLNLVKNFKLAIGFIIYHPEHLLQSRLMMLNELEIPFYVYDNSPEKSEIAELSSRLPFCQYLTEGNNVGLGQGLNTLCSKAYQDGFDGLLFFDQDTCFSESTIYFANSLFSSRFKIFQESYTAIALSAKVAKKRPPLPEDDVQELPLIINSGSIFFLDNLSKIGWHNTTYFVDGVDYEFCLRSHIHGMKVGTCYGVPGFDHVSEQPDETIEFFGKSLLIRRYSSFRVKDALHSYRRLICASCRSGQFRYTALFFRSFLIYVLGLTLSRVLLK